MCVFDIFPNYIQHLDCHFMSGFTERKQQEKSTTEQILVVGPFTLPDRGKAQQLLYLVPCNPEVTQIHETVLQ